MVNRIERLFPGLQRAGYRITSEATEAYNCVAWAAGGTSGWWEPADECFWPAAVPQVDSFEAYVQVFTSLGYLTGATESLEEGFEKVALFKDEAGDFTHAARQLPSGKWTSKLGEFEDIEHELRDLEGDEYGTVALILKRPLPPPA